MRIERLEIARGQSVALLGFDETTAEVLTNLITGATVPDAGEVVAFGLSTRDISDGDEWLKTLDRFGILTGRAVLLDQLTAAQNLAVPFSLELDDMPQDVRSRVAALAAEVGLNVEDLDRGVGVLTPAARVRVQLGRALPLDPLLLIAEHPNALLPPEEVPAFAADFSRVLSRRGAASLVLTADRVFANAVAQEVLTLAPATGVLSASAGWRRWFTT